MAKSKATLLAEAKSLGLAVTTKNTIAEIAAAIAAISQTPVEPVEKGQLEIAEEGVAAEAETAGADPEAKVAKAGKRSAKAQALVEEKQAKEERKASGDEAETKPKPPIKPARSRIERRGKNFRKAAKLIDSSKQYSLSEAVALALKTSPTKFDATVELHLNLNVDPRQADQNIRGNLVLPAGSGKALRVAVFDDGAVAGADISGTENITKMIEKGDLGFDVLIATPAQMPALGKHARTLGPRGLMPNPKSGTVTNDLAKAVGDAKAGRVEYRVDSTGIIHLGVGKTSFSAAQLLQNVEAVLSAVKSAKPASVKGALVKSGHLATTMGPSVKLAEADL